MPEASEIYSLLYKDSPITVEEFSLQRRQLFRIQFQDRTPTLVITRTKNADQEFFWTSIPEGRQQSAEEIGLVIEAYLQQNPKKNVLL